METQIAWTSGAPCPHSDGKGVPICWDCAEAGHVTNHNHNKRDTDNARGDAAERKWSGEEENAEEDDLGATTWQRFKKIGASLRRRPSLGTRSSSAAPLMYQHHQYRPQLHPHDQDQYPLHQPAMESLDVVSSSSSPRPPSWYRHSQSGLEVVVGPRVVSPEDKFSTLETLSSIDGSIILASNCNTPDPMMQRSHWDLATPVAMLVAQQQQQQQEAPNGWDELSRSGRTTLLTAGDDNATTATSLISERGNIQAGKESGMEKGRGEDGEVKEKEQKKHIWGLRKRTFWILVAIAIAAIAAVVVGFAVQATKSRSSSSSKSDSDSDDSDNNEHDPLHTSSRDCLGADGSTYTDPGTGSRWRVECAAAHEGQDLANVEATTMEECVSLCAQQPRGSCVGAIWFAVGPQGTNLNYCWLKSELGGDDAIRNTIDAQSVVRLG